MARTGPTLTFQSVDEQLDWTPERCGPSAGVKENRNLTQTERRPSNLQQPRCLRSPGKWVILCTCVYHSMIGYDMIYDMM